MKTLIRIALAAFAAAATAAAAQEIKIGGLLETSGFVASLGQPGLEGAQLAVEQINAAGGVNGRKVALVNVNSESDNTKTVSGAKRLIEQDKVVAIVGPMSSGSAFAVADTMERARVPMIANGASRGIVLPPDQKKFMFLAPLTDVVVQSAMLKDLQAKGIKRIAILNSDVAFGTSGRDSLEKAAADHGITIVAKETFGNADTDMTPQLTKIRGSDAEATVLWATGPGLAIASKNHRALGIKTPLYLAHSANDFNYLRLAGDAANGVLLPSSKIYVTDSLPDSDPQKKVVAKFVARLPAEVRQAAGHVRGQRLRRDDDPGRRDTAGRHRSRRDPRRDREHEELRRRDRGVRLLADRPLRHAAGERGDAHREGR